MLSGRFGISEHTVFSHRTRDSTVICKTFRLYHGIIAAENPNAGRLVSGTAQPGDRRERARIARRRRGTIAAENPNAGRLVSGIAQPGDRRERARIARRKRGTIAAENPNAGCLVSETAQPGDRRERARIARRRRNDRKATVHFLRSSYRPQHGPQESGQKKGGNFR